MVGIKNSAFAHPLPLRRRPSIFATHPEKWYFFMTMNLQIRRNVIKVSVLLGSLLWIMDGVLDYFFFYEGSFLGLTFTNIPPHELYIRLFWFGGLLVTGLFASWIINDKEEALADKREVEKFLRQSEEKYQQIFNNANDAMYLHELTEEGMPGQ
ncbi:hypothetical protein KGY77_10835, partial [Candidatus Bipolaricaulota bacterium]|nr:hypothetical protein [Candidatus Bipolaricaulota bacterium]